MSSIVKQLIEFIETAERNRKYPRGTAIGRKAALNLFAPELNDNERESLETFKNNLDQIYQNVFNKNKSKMSAESLSTYQNRLKNLIADYEEYGIDPTKLTNWNRPTRKIRSSVSSTVNNKNQSTLKDTQVSPSQDLELSRYELPLRPGVKAIILIPSDITKSEVNKLKKYFEFVESIASEDEQHIQEVEGK